jgi:hypothetical protein
MLFNADRNLKQNLFQMYKKEAEDHYNKKSEMKMRQLNEERTYLENMNKRHQQEEDRRKLEKFKRVTDTMNEYKDMMSHKDQSRYKGKKNEVNINTYGVSMREVNPDNSSQQNFQIQNNQENFNGDVNYEFKNNNNLIQDKFHVQGSSSSDFPGNQNYSEFLNKNFGNNNYDNSRFQKHEQQKSYKEFLDSQVIKYLIKRSHKGTTRKIT